jgi:hypothetical protein
VPGIEPGPRTLTTRPQRRSVFLHNLHEMEETLLSFGTLEESTAHRERHMTGKDTNGDPGGP